MQKGKINFAWEKKGLTKGIESFMQEVTFELGLKNESDFAIRDK